MNGHPLLTFACAVGAALVVATPAFAADPAPPPPRPGAGPGYGMGPGPGPGPRGRWGPDVTPGWALMTETERNAHRERMLALKTREECLAYMTQHREQMAARAKERGVAPPPMRREPCQGFQ